MAPVSMTLSDLEARFQGHCIIQRQISRKWYSYSYNGGLIESRTWSVDLERPQTQISRSGHSLTLNISEMAKYLATVTIEGE